jgi:hypothetical protein
MVMEIIIFIFVPFKLTVKYQFSLNVLLLRRKKISAIDRSIILAFKNGINVQNTANHIKIKIWRTKKCKSHTDKNITNHNINTPHN